MSHKDDLAVMAHLMRRAGFGATRDELEKRVAVGYEATVDELLNPPEDDPAGSAPAAPTGDAVPGPSGPIITDVGGNGINVGDLVAMIGYHITDSGHSPSCWNELHPLKGIAKITQREYNLVGIAHAPDDLYDKYCTALKGFVKNVGKISLTLTHLEHKRVG